MVLVVPHTNVAFAATSRFTTFHALLNASLATGIQVRLNTRIASYRWEA